MPKTLTKADLVSIIKSENDYSLKKSANIVEILLEIIKSLLESGEDILISGFGKFHVRNKRNTEDVILYRKRI